VGKAIPWFHPVEGITMPDLRSTTPRSDLADDLLHGADAIAEFVGMKPRRVFYLCEKQEIPAKKICGRWTSRKSALRKLFDFPA
jgi:hypothetical protein